MSVELKVNRRRIVYWKTFKKPVSKKYSAMITRIVGARHKRRVAREDEEFRAMIESLSSAPARAMLLAMLAAEVEVRIRAIMQLTSGHMGDRMVRQARPDAPRRLD
jgi:hypothetical protein